MKRVLLVDDEIWQVRGLRQMIPWEQYGYQVFATAYDGVSALQIAKRERPDLVLLDIQIPGCNGLEVLRQLHQNNQECRVVIVSGYAEFAYAQKAIRYGASDYLLKPLDERDLLGVLRKLEDGPPESPAQQREAPGGIALQAREYVDAHFCEEDLSVEHLAKQFYVSPVYFGQLFKKKWGVSLSEYVNRKKVDFAEQLLLEGERSITEVAQMVGIPDYFYFSKLYKRFKGISPGKVHQHEAE